MRFLLISFCLLLASISTADEDSAAVKPGLIPGFVPYLGLSVPYPLETLKLTLGSESVLIPNKTYTAIALLDSEGKISKLEYHPDSANYYIPLLENYRNLRFDFFDGVKLGFPIKLPIGVDYFYYDNRKQVRFIFPVSSEKKTDSLLLARFFEINAIEPPELIYLPEIFYKVIPGRDTFGCRTITAHVSLDKNGEIIDIAFPISGQDIMTSKILVALIYAEYAPARLGGEPFDCQFLLTFRIYDNMIFPIAYSQPVNNGRIRNITQKYFLTKYFSDLDISIFPLPRNFATGTISGGTSAKDLSGEISGRIRIDSIGRVRDFRISTSHSDLAQNARKIINLTEWYPAMNNQGETASFSGRVRMIFRRESKVVYIPDWFDF